MCWGKPQSVLLTCTTLDRYAIGNAERPGLPHKIGWLDHLANATRQYYYGNSTGGPTLRVRHSVTHTLLYLTSSVKKRNKFVMCSWTLCIKIFLVKLNNHYSTPFFFSPSLHTIHSVLNICEGFKRRKPLFTSQNVFEVMLGYVMLGWLS